MPAAAGLLPAGGAAGPWRGLDSGASSAAPSQAFLSFALVFCALAQAAFRRLHDPTQVSAPRHAGEGPCSLSPAVTGGDGRVWGPRWGHSLPAGWPSAGLRAEAPGAGRRQVQAADTRFSLRPPRGPEDGTWGLGEGSLPGLQG